MKITKIAAADTNKGSVQSWSCYYLLWIDLSCNFTEESNQNLEKDLRAEKAMLVDQRQCGWVNYINSSSKVQLTVRAGNYYRSRTTFIKNNKITAEKQDTDKHCFERKAWRRKWLATLCLSQADTNVNTCYPMLLEHKWDGISMILLPKHKSKLQLTHSSNVIQ